MLNENARKGRGGGRDENKTFIYILFLFPRKILVKVFSFTDGLSSAADIKKHVTSVQSDFDRPQLQGKSKKYNLLLHVKYSDGDLKCLALTKNEYKMMQERN